MYASVLAFHVGDGDPNPDPYAYMTSSLPAKLPPQLLYFRLSNAKVI